MVPLNVLTPEASVKLSSPTPPSSVSIELKLIPATPPAFAPLMLKVSLPAVPTIPSLPLPPASTSILVNNVEVFSVPALEAFSENVLVPSVTASVSLPAEPPLMVPLNVPTPEASVKLSSPAPPSSVSIELKLIPATLPAFAPVMLKASLMPVPTIPSLPLPPVSTSILVNGVEVFSVPALEALSANVLVPSVTASVSLPAEPPLIVPLNELIPEASVKLSSLAPPSKASIELKFIPATLPAFAPVMLKTSLPELPTISSLPVPPVSTSMLLNRVVVFSVPAFSPLNPNVLVPFVTASVSLPAEPPSMVPLNEPTLEASRKLSSAVPPISFSSVSNAA